MDLNALLAVSLIGAQRAISPGVGQNQASQQFPKRMTLLWGETQDYSTEAAVAAIEDPDFTYVVNPANTDQILTPFFQDPLSKITLKVFAEGYFITSETVLPTLEQVRFLGRPFNDFTLGNPISTRVSSQGNLIMVPFDAPVELNPNEPLSALVTGTGAEDCIVGLVVSIQDGLDRAAFLGRTMIEDARLQGTGMIAWGFPGAPTWTALPPDGLAANGIPLPGVDHGSVRLVAPAVSAAYVWNTFVGTPGGFTLNNNTTLIAGTPLIIPPNRKIAFKLVPPGVTTAGKILFAGLGVAPNLGVVFSPWTYMGSSTPAGTQGINSGVINYSGWYGVFDSQNLPRIKVLSTAAVTPEFTARILLL